MSHPDEPESPGEASYSVPPEPTEPVPATPAPVDPERGLRGVMSAILVFEAIAILLGLTVIANGGTRAPGWQIGVIVAVGLAHLLTPIVIARRHAVSLILALQAVLIACCAIDAAIGITGIVFLVVWLLILLMRREYRRRIANGFTAGTMA
jgi:hypothetical protein